MICHKQDVRLTVDLHLKPCAEIRAGSLRWAKSGNFMLSNRRLGLFCSAKKCAGSCCAPEANLYWLKSAVSLAMPFVAVSLMYRFLGSCLSSDVAKICCSASAQRVTPLPALLVDCESRISNLRMLFESSFGRDSLWLLAVVRPTIPPTVSQ